MTLEADGATFVTNPHNEPVAIRALLLGERLDTRSIESGNVLSTAPVATSMVGGGIAVLFRYGVVILFGASRDAADRLLASVRPSVADPLPVPEQEETRWSFARVPTSLSTLLSMGMAGVHADHREPGGL